MRRRLWLVVPILIIALAGVVVLGRMRGPTPAQNDSRTPSAQPTAPAVPVEVATVRRETVERTVQVSGSVTSARLARIFARRSGTVSRVLVRDGDQVSAGQPLVILDAREASTRVRQAAASARAADAQLALVRAGARPEQIAQAEEQVRQADAQVSAAQAGLQGLERGARRQERLQATESVRRAESNVAAARAQLAAARTGAQTADVNLLRMEALFRDGAVSQSQLDQARLQADQAHAAARAAEAQLRAAGAELNSARQQQSLVEAGPRSEEIDAARAQVDQMRAGAAQARQQLALLRRGARAEEIGAAAAQREQAHAMLAEARQQLEDMTVRAPFIGRVARLRLSPGEFVSSGEFGSNPVAVVYDDRAMEAEVTVGERDAAAIRPGQPATLRPEVALEERLAAVVKTVTPLAEPGSRAVAVRLRVPPGEGALLPGTFVRGAIVVERRANVLTVPRIAVRNGAAPTVWVVRGDRVATRSVAPGLLVGARQEITRGIREGERVVTLGPERLAPGTRVVVIEGNR